MAITIRIPTFGSHVLAATVVYALPGRVSRIHILGAGAVDVSADGATWEAVTPDANKEFITGGNFIRSTVGATISVRI